MEQKGARVTIAEVARAAGVSTATVSVVLNGRAGVVQISEPTRASVQATAARLGYTANHTARSLRRRRTSWITLLVFQLGNPYYTDIASAARIAAARRGYEVNVVEAAGADAELYALDHLRSGSSDGVIIATSRHGASDAATERLRALVHQGMPAIMVIDCSPDPAIPAIRIDDAAGAYLATTHLLRLGYRRIAYLTHPSGPSFERAEASHRMDRYRGYERALADAGIGVEPGWVIQGLVTMEGGREAVRAMLARERPYPTALFCFNDQMAIGALRALYEAGIRVPDDVAVVGFDGIEPGAFTTPALTTVEHSRADLGQCAVETLLNLLDGHAPPSVEHVVPVRLIVRESCGARPRGVMRMHEGV